MAFDVLVLFREAKTMMYDWFQAVSLVRRLVSSGHGVTKMCFCLLMQLSDTTTLVTIEASMIAIMESSMSSSFMMEIARLELDDKMATLDINVLGIEHTTVSVKGTA